MDRYRGRLCAALQISTLYLQKIETPKSVFTVKPICIAPKLFVPGISIRNLNKIASFYPRLMAIAARFNSGHKLRIG